MSFLPAAPLLTPQLVTPGELAQSHQKARALRKQVSLAASARATAGTISSFGSKLSTNHNQPLRQQFL